jgi:hypothetical protein
MVASAARRRILWPLMAYALATILRSFKPGVRSSGIVPAVNVGTKPAAGTQAAATSAATPARERDAPVDPGWWALLVRAGSQGLPIRMRHAAAIMLAQLLDRRGIPAHLQPYPDVRSAKSWRAEAPDARLVCLSYFGAGANPAHVRYLIRRLKRMMPEAKFLAGFWLLGDDPSKMADWKAAVGADFVATSLTEAVEICVEESRRPENDEATEVGEGLSTPHAELVRGSRMIADTTEKL